MGKVMANARRVSRRRPKASKKRSSGLTAEQRKNYELLREYLAETIKKVERMTPEEKAEADAEWELFKNTMNEERAKAGARLLYVD